MNCRWFDPFHARGAPAQVPSLGRVPLNPRYLYTVFSSPGGSDEPDTFSPPAPRMLSDMAAVFEVPSAMSVIRCPNWATNTPSAPTGEPLFATPLPWQAT